MAKRVLYKANLGNKKHIERVELNGSDATLVRFGKAVKRFKPTASQRAKIKKGRGRINIYD